MIEALRFQQASPKLVAPPIAEGFPNGLVVQLWIRRTGDTTRQPIVELAGATSRIVLGTGARPDVLSLAVITNGVTTEISAPGALPIARWVQVRAILRPDGTAELDVLGMTLARGKLSSPGTEARTLRIGGLIGELTQLQVWKHQSPAKLSYGPPLLGGANLWAWYPLAALEWDAATKQSVTKDASSNQRHATFQGSTNAPVPIVHDEPLDRGQAPHLRFVSNTKTPNIGPLIGPNNMGTRLTLEAWVCPTGDSSMPVLQLQGTNARITLAAGGPEGELALLSIDKDAQVTVLSRVTGLVLPNQWSHVAVHLHVEKVSALSRLTVSLFHQGQLRKTEPFTMSLSYPAANRAGQLARSCLIPEVHLGGQAPGYPLFRGGMAEVRIWRGSDQERLESMWLTRARGDESQLIMCYRLDTEPSKPLVDISPSKGSARAPNGSSLQKDQCPPLAATSGALAFRVQGRGKLLREQLKPASTPSTKINLQVTNTTTGQTTNLRPTARDVFHATIEVATRSGNSPLGRLLEVRIDQPLTLLQSKGAQVVQTPWAANQTQTIPLPASGQIRLRFAAKQLSCPTIRVRIAGTPGGVWTIIRPDEQVQMRLSGATAESLKSPSDGRRSPLPVETRDEDAQALVDALTQLRTQFVRDPNPPKYEASLKLLGPIDDVVDAGVDWTTDRYEDVASGTQSVITGGQDLVSNATTIAKSAGQLIVRGTEELDALVEKCKQASAWVSDQAIATAISKADQLAFVAAQSWDGAARWVEIVGTSIVNGSEVAWRVIVSGVEDALSAITQLIERIGATIQEWIEYLAMLFMWDDFLDASDEAHEVIEAAMGSVGQQIAGIDAIKTQMSNALRETVESAIGKRSLADVFGIDADASSEAFDQLDYVLEQVQDLLESSDLNWAKKALSEDAGIGPSAAVNTQAGEIERAKPFGDPSDVLAFLNKPLSEVLASNDKLANGSSSLFDAVFDPITESSTELIEQLDSAMFSRLSVPYLTDFIESVILCGRTLTIARIMALMAAIPYVLSEKTESKSSKSSKSLSMVKSNDEGLSQAEQDRQEADRSTRWALWCVIAAGLINTIVIVAKSVAERRTQSTANSELISFFQLTSGSLGIFRGIILVGRVPAFPASTRTYAAINASAEMASGMCAAFFGLQGLKKVAPTQTRKDWSGVETALQVILGATVIASSAIALSKDLGDDRTKTAFAFRCSSWVLALCVRTFEKFDDRDTSGRLKYLTMGLAALSVVVEIGEAIYGNVGETDSQT